jgi:biopolymer transport protein ExbD
MKIQSGFEEKRARVEIIALLDVLLIVLIFFVYLALTMTSQRTVDVSLPDGTGHRTASALTIVVTKDNVVMMNGQPTTPGEAALNAAGQIRAQTGSTDLVVLRSDRASRLGLTFELLSLLKREGVGNVSIEVDGK